LISPVGSILKQIDGELIYYDEQAGAASMIPPLLVNKLMNSLYEFLYNCGTANFSFAGSFFVRTSYTFMSNC